MQPPTEDQATASALAPVHLGALPIERMEPVLPAGEYSQLMSGALAAATLMHGRVLWNVNSTAQGGGVAEMLRPLLSYARGAGVDARWSVMRGSPAFFDITKRLHNRLHGYGGGGAELGAKEREIYERTCAEAAARLIQAVSPVDVVMLHDPQTAGLAPMLRRHGVPVIWRCHVGIDSANEVARSAVEFLLPYVRDAARTVFSRRAYIWEGVDPARARIIAPSIDAFSPKNEELEPDVVRAILGAAHIIPIETPAPPIFTRTDGSRGRVEMRATMVEDQRLTEGDRFVLQVSRWDRLKDPFGVMTGFSEHVDHALDCQLVLAGPAPSAVADDPEAAGVLEEMKAGRLKLPPDRRARVHLALLPMDDVEANAAIVNALQRRATIVVQKSLAEGFGLTVAEAMWKGRPVVASAVGGILDQIEDGVTGILIDARDLARFGSALEALLRDPEQAEAMGRAAHERVRAEYLTSRHLLQYLSLLQELLAGWAG